MGHVVRRIDARGRGTALLAVSLVVVLCAPAAFGAAPPAQGAPPAGAAPASVPAVVSVQALAPAAPDFHYDPTGRRDPFKSLLILQEKKRDVSMLPPIQQLELPAVKVTGLILDTVSGNRAMVKGGDNKTYVIKKGDIIGKNEGEVVSIDANGVTVKEKFVDYMNKETTTTTVLKVEKQK